MEQERRAAGMTTGSPSIPSNSLSHSFAPIDDIRQAILSVARIEDHAERAGFRRGRCGRWHSAFRRDENPSCSIRNGYITDWGRNQRWNVIDLEMLATGQPFMQALRALASEYGVRMLSDAYNPSVAKQRALDWRDSQERAFNWRAGFLEIANEILEEEKAKLFDPLSGPANESLILTLTSLERMVREAESKRRLVRLFEAFSQVMPGLALHLAKHGERRRHERQAAFNAILELVARAGDDRW
jgi:hypothetical protein